MRKNHLKGNSVDAILLAVIRLLTTFLGIFSTMLLSKSLSLIAYGTYSQANLIISMGSSFSIIGLTDATSYFFNRAETEEEAKENINTIFAIQCMIGILLGCGIIIFRKAFILYFQNEKLLGLFIYIAFRPLLSNLIAMLQNLQVSIGRAKAVAVRNIVLSTVKIIAIYLAVNVFNDIKTIFVIMLLLDAITVVYYFASFGREKFRIQIWRLKPELIRGILSFSIPMGIYVLTNALARDIDKVCIGRLAGTEMLAIYTNCSTILPVDIISAAFLTVIIPVMTRFIAEKKLQKGAELFSKYIQIGYLTTVTFSVAILALSRQVIDFLYGSKYFVGEPIFVLYIVVSALRFANLSLVISANGETKLLMSISIIGLAVNVVLNIAFYYLFGFVGPAWATVVITSATTLVMLIRSCKILQTNMKIIFNARRFMVFCFELVAIMVPFRFLAKYMNDIGISSLFCILLIGGSMCVIIFLLNYKNIIALIKEINILTFCSIKKY